MSSMLLIGVTLTISAAYLLQIERTIQLGGSPLLVRCSSAWLLS